MTYTEVDIKGLRRAWSSFWWLVLIQSLIAIGFGLYTILNPSSSPATLVQIIAVFIVVNGVIEIIQAFLERRELNRWGSHVFGGVVTVVVGVLVFALASLLANVTLTVLIYLVATGMLIGGALAAINGARTRSWGHLFVGALWVVFSLVLFTQTNAAANVLVWLTGLFLLLLGAGLLYLAFRLRSIKEQVEIAVMQSQATIVEAQARRAAEETHEATAVPPTTPSAPKPPSPTEVGEDKPVED